ncbi:ATP-binding cassette sub-family G member 1-like [Macrosteles quadrilineatus]|uniref:ATP-binding cassette sub-family G member 1-like n=1 Tax=Macrosteles quadrilineatus TaxID=74068 RepID=UPI0023E1EA45|nr:ATP-binding cassette sub-family G member 1-like [Macrosteles quadrilineatus]XP_054263720.1 ATP-binding cassette sub-family G member 1-like [Macrosteles quadrilineatus]
MSGEAIDPSPIQLNDLSEFNDSSGSILDQTPSCDSKLLLKLRKPSNISINFSDINYTVTSWTLSDRGFPIKRERKTILKAISGDFRAYELTGIIGPSGSGKSSLLDILSGYSLDFTGQIEHNGCARDLRQSRKQVAYIMQDCNLQPLLTITEAMVTSAHLKLGNDYTLEEKLAIVEDILITLHLSHKSDSLTRTLSGGEKKRLAIALELVNNPPLMFFDEPTSGLDYFTAKKCLQYLKQLTASGYNIVCTLHQPSASMFDLLDHVYVIAGGCCVYQGGTKGLTAFLDDLGLACPEYHNLADHVLDVSVGEYGPYMDKLVDKINNGKSKDWRRTALQTSGHSLDCQQDKGEVKISSYSGSCFSHFSVLVLRMLKIISRDKFYTNFRISIHLAVGSLLGFFYLGIGNDAAFVFDNFRLLFFSLMFLMYTALSTMIISFPLEMPIIVREHFNRWYSPKSYYIALTVTDIPIQVVCTSIYCIIVYVMSEQPLEMFRFNMLLLMFITVTLFSQAVGVLVGATLSVKLGVIFGPLAILPWLIFSGFFLLLPDAPHYLQWLFHISYLKYAIEGLMQAIYGYDRDKIPCSVDYCHFRAPEKFLKQLSMHEANYWVCLSVIASLYLIVKVVTYYILRYRLTHCYR